jgi:hypothetical protein
MHTTESHRIGARERRVDDWSSNVYGASVSTNTRTPRCTVALSYICKSPGQRLQVERFTLRYCYNTASKALKSNLNLLMHIVGLVLLKELAYQPHCAGCTCQSCADYKSDAGENGCVRKGATLGVDKN